MAAGCRNERDNGKIKIQTEIKNLPEVQKVTEEKSPEKQTGHRWRILALDDHEDTLKVIRYSLQDKYDVLTANDPMDIYDLINIFEPDLLILDIMMPKITGFKLLDILHKDAKYKDLPVIILSAKNTTREIKYGYKLGARLYLTKPFDPERLQRNVDLIFERTPPPLRKKQYTIKQVYVQIELRKSYESGALTFSSQILNSSDLKSDEFRKALEDAKHRNGEKHGKKK